MFHLKNRMEPITDLSAFRIREHLCHKEHESRRNKWIGILIPNLCLECNGKDRTIRALEVKLRVKIALCEDPLYNLMFETYPELRDPRNLKYRCTCVNGHSWETTLSEMLTGRWCEVCLLNSHKITTHDLDRLARRKKGRCLSSDKMPFSVHSRHQFICVNQHLFYEYPLEIIYGSWCKSCHYSIIDYKEKKVVLGDTTCPRLPAIDTDISLTQVDWLSICGPQFSEKKTDDTNIFTIMTSDMSRETKAIVDYDQIKNPAHIVPIRCRNGHVNNTAPMLHHPIQWCHYPQCNGTDGALEILARNMEAEYELEQLFVDPIPYPQKPECEKGGQLFKFQCKSGHTWTSSANAVFDGLWCDHCLCVGYSTREDWKRLAATFGGKYQVRKSRGDVELPITKFICCQGSEISKSPIRMDRLSLPTVELSVLRGERCTEHKQCIKIAEEGLLDPKAKGLAMRSELYTPVEVKLKAVRLLDQAMDLTTEQIENAINKYPRVSTKVLYLRAKYNTIPKLQELAESRNGKIIDEKFTGFSCKYTWECSQCQFNGIYHRWNEDLDSILFGSWCRVCRDDDERNLSKGNLAVRRYLESKGLKYIPEYSYDDCRYIKPLKFDFYVPELNLLIEFDGCQHFNPVEIWGGRETFQIQLERDNIKANYCKRKRIRLIRISDKKRVDEHLTPLINQLPTHVMYICTPPGYSTTEPGYPRQNDEKYIVVDFSAETSH